MLCIPKKTIETIVASGNHYVAQVKGNQKTLFQEVQRIIVDQPPLDYFETYEKGHGRQSSWHVRVFDAQQSHKAQEWKNLRRVIHVHRIRKENDKEAHENSLYISDRFETKAKFFHTGIRGHWGIENRLHWVKDVIFKEDKNKIREGTGPIAATVFTTIAINILRKEGFESITDGNVFARANIEDFICHLRT